MKAAILDTIGDCIIKSDIVLAGENIHIPVEVSKQIILYFSFLIALRT